MMVHYLDCIGATVKEIVNLKKPKMERYNIQIILRRAMCLDMKVLCFQINIVK